MYTGDMAYFVNLTYSMLGEKISRRQFEIFTLFFSPANRVWHCMQIVPLFCHIVFPSKNKKKSSIFRLPNLPVACFALKCTYRDPKNKKKIKGESNMYLRFRRSIYTLQTARAWSDCMNAQAVRIWETKYKTFFFLMACYCVITK